MKQVTWLMAAGFAVAALAGCGGGSKALKDGELKQTIEMENAGDWIEVMGIGAPATDSVGTQRKATSRNAAVVDAQFQLASKIKGVKVEGGITIEKAMETDSKIRSSVDAMIKGFEPTKWEWTGDDGCVVTMRISKKMLAKELGIKIE